LAIMPQLDNQNQEVSLLSRQMLFKQVATLTPQATLIQ